MKFSEENLLDIALIFEQANGNVLTDNDASLVNNSGLDHYKPEELEELVASSIEGAEPEFRGRAYWVLGKRFNKSLVPRFNKWLEMECKNQNSELVYQLLIALDNLELPVFCADRDSGYSVQESDLNLRDARSYLENHA